MRREYIIYVCVLLIIGSLFACGFSNAQGEQNAQIMVSSEKQVIFGDRPADGNIVVMEKEFAFNLKIKSPVLKLSGGCEGNKVEFKDANVPVRIPVLIEYSRDFKYFAIYPKSIEVKVQW